MVTTEKGLKALKGIFAKSDSLTVTRHGTDVFINDGHQLIKMPVDDYRANVMDGKHFPVEVVVEAADAITSYRRLRKNDRFHKIDNGGTEEKILASARTAADMHPITWEGVLFEAALPKSWCKKPPKSITCAAMTSGKGTPLYVPYDKFRAVMDAIGWTAVGGRMTNNGNRAPVYLSALEYADGVTPPALEAIVMPQAAVTSPAWLEYALTTPEVREYQRRKLEGDAAA